MEHYLFFWEEENYLHQNCMCDLPQLATEYLRCIQKVGIIINFMVRGTFLKLLGCLLNPLLTFVK